MILVRAIRVHHVDVRSPERVLVKAIFLPSGETAGLESFAEGILVRFIYHVPFGIMA
jgi:hypothetical protein